MEVDEKNGLSADSIATVDVDNLGSNISLLRLKLRLGLRESWKDGFHESECVVLQEHSHNLHRPLQILSS